MASAFKPAFNVRLITIDEFYPEELAKADIIAFPGGMGDADDFDNIFSDYEIATLKNYLANGGTYLGICMGAYWAGKHYFDILGDTEPVQYITRPNADIITEYETIAKVKWFGKDYPMYFYDGCAFVGDLGENDVVATYANGDPMAIIKDNVGVIGCHPESEEWWHDSIGYWHSGKNHKLLLDFALIL
jgi:glutamine amidotransferase-like uncharacterized protein